MDIADRVMEAVARSGGNLRRLAEELGVAKDTAWNISKQEKVRGAFMASKAKLQKKKIEQIKKVMEKKRGVLAFVAKALKVERETVWGWIMAYPALRQCYVHCNEGNADKVEDKILSMCDEGNVDAMKLYYSHVRQQRTIPPDGVREVLEKVKAGEMKPADAAILCDIMGFPIPKSLDMKMKEKEAEEQLETGNVFTDEELEQRADEVLAEEERQISGFVPERRQEVAELKEQMAKADSFRDGAEVGDGDAEHGEGQHDIR